MVLWGSFYIKNFDQSSHRIGNQLEVLKESFGGDCVVEDLAVSSSDGG